MELKFLITLELVFFEEKIFCNFICQSRRKSSLYFQKTSIVNETYFD